MRQPPLKLGTVSEKLHPFQRKKDQIIVKDAIVIIEVIGNIHTDNNLLEEVAGELQGIQLGRFLLACV